MPFATQILHHDFLRYALRELNCLCPQCAVAQFMSEGQFMSFSSIHAAFGNSLRATSLAFSIFSIIKRNESASLLVSERAQIAPRWLVKRRAECNSPSGNACTAKEYNMSDRADELAVLDYTPTGASALCALGATHCVCLTANRRGAICGICPREQAPGYKLP